MRIYLLLALTLFGCASPRTNGLIGTNYSEQPPRVSMRWECNGKVFTTQGTGVCEQKGPSVANVSVKIPPLEGRVICSNGQLKLTEDFNWYPKEGFFLWKKKPIKDTWAELELGEIATTFGDWPVAIDVAAVQPDQGVTVTRGALYHRVCNDVDVPCSKLEVEYECSGVRKKTGTGVIGKCERMAGSAQSFRVKLKGETYEARPGAKIYLSVPRLGIPASSSTPKQAEFTAGEMNLETPEIPAGPSLVGIRMAWVEGVLQKSVETRILVMGFSPEWTGIDQPHWVDKGNQIEFVRPVLSDSMELNLYEGREMKKKAFSFDRVISFPKPKGPEIACAFAWQRSSSDQTALCLNSQMQEVQTP